MDHSESAAVVVHDGAAHPIQTLLARLPSDRSRTLYYAALESVAGLALGVVDEHGAPGRADPWGFPWHALTYTSATALRASLIATPRRSHATGAVAPPAPRTVNLHLTALRAVLVESFELGHIDPDRHRQLRRALPTVRLGTDEPAGRAVSPAEVGAVVDAIGEHSNTDQIAARDLCLFAVLHSGGLRAKEDAQILDHVRNPGRRHRDLGSGLHERIGRPNRAGRQGCHGGQR